MYPRPPAPPARKAPEAKAEAIDRQGGPRPPPAPVGPLVDQWLRLWPEAEIVFLSFDQPINQWTNQSTNPQIHQPIDQPTPPTKRRRRVRQGPLTCRKQELTTTEPPRTYPLSEGLGLQPAILHPTTMPTPDDHANTRRPCQHQTTMPSTRRLDHQPDD